MKKALIIIIALIACCFFIANYDYIQSCFNAMQQGSLIPIIIAVILMLLRHVTQAESYKAAFEAVGCRITTLWQDIVLIFSLVFINTFCLFSGATGVAFIIDDLHRKGADLGTATSGAILSQIGYFAAVLVISIIGFVAMMIDGQINVIFVLGGLALAGVLIALSSMFVLGIFKPSLIHKLFGILQKLITNVLGLFKRAFDSRWGEKTAASIIQSSRVMTKNPAGTIVSVGFAALSALLNMTCLIAIGYSFGFYNIPALIAAFSLAAVSVLLSPTPQGVGVVEAAIAAVVTGAGCNLATATAIALVYRGIMFWIPFAIGALLLSQSDFFKSKKETEVDAKAERKAQDSAWIAGTLVGLVGAANIVLNFLPAMLKPYQILVEWINLSDVFSGPMLSLAGALMIILAIGLVLRLRMAWALTVVVLVLTAGCEFLFYATMQVAILALVLAIWLFTKHKVFTRSLDFSRLKTGGWRAVISDGRPLEEKPAAAEAPAEDPTAEDAVPSGGSAAPAQSKS